MMASMAYNCGYCGKPGVAQYDPEFVVNAEFWKSKLHCNRCADYRTALLRLRDQIRVAILPWWQSSATGRRPAELQGEVRSKLEALTRQISHITSKHWNCNDTWDQEFALVIMDKPERAEWIVNDFVAGMKRDAQRARKTVIETADFPTI